MNAFTFTPHPLSLMPLRLWLARQEIKFRVARLGKKVGVRPVLEDTLLKQTDSLYKKVTDLWKHFGIKDYPTPPSFMDEIYGLMFANYILTIEHRHYQRLLEKEQKKDKAKMERIRRMLPSWIKADERCQKQQAYGNKEDWKYNWKSSELESSDDVVGDGLFISWFQLLTGMFVVGFLTIPFFYAMLNADRILFVVANFMVNISKGTGFTFQEVYAAFGYAIWLLLFVFSGFAVVYKAALKPSLLNSIHKLNDVTQERLAELAYTLEQHCEKEKDQ